MATGDRSFEFPAFKVDENELTERYQTTIHSIRELWQSHSPKISNSIFELYEDSGLQVLPKHHTIQCLVRDIQNNQWLGSRKYGWLVILRPTFSRTKEIS